MSGPDERATFWDDRADAWARHADAMEGFARQFGDPAVDALAPTPGQHLADLGCGPGTTSVLLGDRVGPDGSVTGIDVSARMVEAARAGAGAAGAGNVRFEVGDPTTGPIGQMLSVGALGEAWAAADAEARAEAVADVRAGCDVHRHGDGWRLPATALVVSAVASG